MKLRLSLLPCLGVMAIFIMMMMMLVLIMIVIITMNICRADVELDIEDFNRIGEKVPLVANLRPHGQVESFC